MRLFVIVYLVLFIWVAVIKLNHYIYLQGDMGFQGRPGPHGPQGVGEAGLPVS